MVRIVTISRASGAVTTLQRVRRQLDDMTPAMRAIAGVLSDETDRAFIDQADPETGAPWAPLKPSTANREVDGRRRGERPILQVTGLLAGSFRPEWGKQYAAVGTNDIRAATHHFGAKRGEYGAAAGAYTYDSNAGTVAPRQIPIPWGDIPARPLAGVSPSSLDEIETIIANHLVV